MRANRKKILVSITVVLLLSVLMSWTTNNPGRILFIERIVADALRPFQKAASSVTGFFVNGWRFLGDIRDVYNDNQRLLAEMERFEGMDLKMLEVMQENRRLRDLLEFEKIGEHQLVSAQVIGRNPSNWFHTLTIDKGSRDGIKVDMPVVTNKGLVGKIVDVQPSYSKVQLLISPSSGISAIVQRTRDNGVLAGLSTPRGYARITRIDQYADLKEGDVIISSPLTGIYPKGLVIGRVVEVSEDPITLERSGLVRPEVDFDRLEEVLIIVNYQVPVEVGEDGGGR